MSGAGPAGRPRVVLLRSRVETPDAYGEALGAEGFDFYVVTALEMTYAPEAVRAALARESAPLVLTSRHAVEALRRADVNVTGRRAFAVGPATRQAAEALGLDVDDAAPGDAAALAAVLVERRLARVHFLCSDRRLDMLPQRLAQAGAIVVETIAYRTTPRASLRPEEVAGADAVVFFSPSTVEAWRRSGLTTPSRAIAFGETTAQALRDAGWPPCAVAEAPTPEGVVRACRVALG